jgi:farnesyl-diphosphate farnesyltransferase
MASDETALTLLSDILPRVSRSFYLSLRILPQTVRQSLGLAYLFCRAADTIADTALLPRAQRLSHLDQYRRAFSDADFSTLSAIQQALSGPQQNSAERELLLHLAECFSLLASFEQADQERICELVLTLTQGMQMDLSVFPGEAEGKDASKIVALQTRTELDQYTYYVAGCVGEFWTKTIVAHRPALQHWQLPVMVERSIQFGKGLQLTNILRDLAQDLRVGRCYLPQKDLTALGVQPRDLMKPEAITRIRPLLNELLELTLSYYQAGWAYTLAFPKGEWRLRLACAWPLLIGVSTLTLLRHSSQLLEPSVRLKIARSQVYAIVLRSLLGVWYDRALQQQYVQLQESVRRGVGG